MARFLLSPKVEVNEIDLTGIVPAVSTTVGAYAGIFTWGPVDQVVLLSNEGELVQRFGRPNSDNYEHFFTAANFLSYGSALRLVRVVNEDDTGGLIPAVNAVTNGTPVLVKNETEYENNIEGLVAETDPEFIAKYPGDLGNNIGITIANKYNFETWAYRGRFSDAPDDNEYHIVVYDATGIMTGTAGTVLELYQFVSTIEGTQYPDGANAYFKKILEEESRYVWSGRPVTDLDITPYDTVTISAATVADFSGSTVIGFEPGDDLVVTVDGTVISSDDYTITSDTVTFDTAQTGDVRVYLSEDYTQTFSGGDDGTVTLTDTIDEVTFGYDLFSDPEALDISLVMLGANIDANRVVANHIINLCESRKDCVAYISPPKSAVVGNFGDELEDVIAYRAGTVTEAGLPSTSYAVMDSGWKMMFDRYNDVNRWVPLNGDIAGLTARTDFLAEPWFSPAGYNRGQIKNVIKFAYNPNEAHRDELYKKGINPVISTRGSGNILFGDKTLLARPSAFDRINVRRLFIILEKAIATAAKFFLFELNDEFTRAQFRNMVEPYLRDIAGRRGIYDFKVVCDETNNTGEVIDANEFVADIYIKPARSINFITLNFIAVRTAVSFDEVIGNF